MIVDTVKNMPLYYKTLPQLETVKNFVDGFAAAEKKTGRYDLDGERLFVNASSYVTSPETDKLLEAHRKYADVQVMISGREYIGWSPLEGLREEKEEFSKGGDIAFYSGAVSTKTLLEENTFVMLLPGDAHMPCVKVDEAEPVLKLVFKVLL